MNENFVSLRRPVTHFNKTFSKLLNFHSWKRVQKCHFVPCSKCILSVIPRHTMINSNGDYFVRLHISHVDFQNVALWGLPWCVFNEALKRRYGKIKCCLLFCKKYGNHIKLTIFLMSTTTVWWNHNREIFSHKIDGNLHSITARLLNSNYYPRNVI